MISFYCINLLFKHIICKKNLVKAAENNKIEELKYILKNYREIINEKEAKVCLNIIKIIFRNLF